MDTNSIELLEKLPHELAMNTKVWGPPTWFFLHSMAMSYPKKININNKRHVVLKEKMYNLLSSLGYILPCPICGESYNYYITQSDYQIWNYLDSRKNLTYFIYKIHNLVNEKLGVPSCDIPTYYEVLKFYSRFIAGNPCVVTTDKEREIKKLQGCKNSDFKQYKCIVNVLDTYNNVTEQPEKLTNNNNNKENFTNLMNLMNINCDYIHVILFIIIIILIIIIIFLLKNNLKKSI